MINGNAMTRHEGLGLSDRLMRVMRVTSAHTCAFASAVRMRRA